MCGLVGFVSDNELFEEYSNTLPHAIELLAHRGPDADGMWVSSPCGLGSTRLAIVDLSATGNQPMTDESGEVCIAYNGEIYNFRKLREDLQAKGHRFRSGTDTEVILRLYKEYGDACVHYLRGMFAFAIWDSRNQRLLLGRDIMGEKPLYYYHDSNKFLFGSEIKAILKFPHVPKIVNQDAVPHYLVHGYVPAPETFFKGIHELPPGHILILEQGQIAIKQYWDIPHGVDVPIGISEHETSARLLELLSEAVRSRLMSDVPLGAFLSGGVDSSAIVALMTRFTDAPVKTFSIGFAGDQSFDELDHARFVARTFETDHHEFVVKPDAIELLPQLVRHYDQPFADSSALPTFLVSQLTREYVTVALTGDGGDELFAGYDRFIAAQVAERYRRAPKAIQSGLTRFAAMLPESTSYGGFTKRIRRFVEHAASPLPQRYLGWVGVFQDEYLREILRGYDPTSGPGRRFEEQFESVQTSDLLSQLLYVNSKTYLPGDLLVKVDRMSMAHSLETRAPLLDQELVEFAATIPSNMKIRRLTSKHIFKEALKGVIPQQILKRKKHGFGVPVGKWFRGELYEYSTEVLLSSQATQRGYFQIPALRRLLSEHQSGRRDHGQRLWALLTFELWHRLYID